VEGGVPGARAQTSDTADLTAACGHGGKSGPDLRARAQGFRGWGRRGSRGLQDEPFLPPDFGPRPRCAGRGGLTGHILTYPPAHGLSTPRGRGANRGSGRWMARTKKNRTGSPPPLIQLHLGRTFPGPGGCTFISDIGNSTIYFPFMFLLLWGVRLFGDWLRPAGGVLVLGTCAYSGQVPQG